MNSKESSIYFWARELCLKITACLWKDECLGVGESRVKIVGLKKAVCKESILSDKGSMFVGSYKYNRTSAVSDSVRRFRLWTQIVD